MKILKSYFKKRKKALNLILEKSPDRYTVKTFHELRLEIKKLEALFELIAFSSKKFKLQKTFTPFRIIFKKAGKIREIQLEQTLLEEQPNFHLLKKYPNQLKKLETKKIKNFFATANKHLIKKLKGKYRKIIWLFSKISTKDVNDYRYKTRKELEKLIRKNIFKKKQIHDFRKRLKVYQYNEKITNLHQKKRVPAQDKLSDLLGKWHDYNVVILDLRKIISTLKKNSNERDQLSIIKTLMTSKRALLFRKINANLTYQTLL